MRPLRALALDLSLAKTGLAATHLSSGEPRLFTETIHTDRSATKPTVIDHVRLHKIFTRVAVAAQCQLDIVAIEKPLVVKNTGDGPLRLAELHGLLKHWLFSRGIPYAEVHPSHVKQWATGSGAAGKGVVLASMLSHCAVLGKSGPQIADDNAADAMSMLSMLLDAYGQPLFEVPDTNRQALPKTTWPRLDAIGGR